MSLKNIIRKSIASLGAVSIVFGHCSLCGVGLSQVIAENLNAPEINIELVNEKYVQYQYKKVAIVEEQEVEEEVKGVAIQSKLSAYPQYNQDTYLPTESAEISVNLPEMNGYLPSKAAVVEAITKSTTGKEIDTNVNQNYDSNSGLLTVSYNNTPDENENIYSTYNENAKDEFEIIYIYPAEAYTGNEEEIKIESSVNAKMTFKAENGSVTTEKTQTFELIEKDNKGDITTFGVTELKENIYKGFLYSNVENETNYDTEYKTVSTLCVLNSQIVNEITMEMGENKFVLNDEEKTEVSTNGNIVYKTTAVTKADFDKILGQNGFIEFYNGEDLIATVKYIEVTENEETVKKLAVIYSDENINILSDEDISAIVQYPENITNVNIKTSKPQVEGFLNFENQNKIKASKNYGSEIKELKSIKATMKVNEYISNTQLLLSEPEAKVSTSLSNSSFSTLQNSKTILTVKLDDTNASTKLFDNPTIQIKMPNGIKSFDLSSPEILNGNGLTIKNKKVENNTIILELTGKQTSYDLNNVSGGVSIVMDIENIDFEDTTPTHTDKIEVKCIEENKEIAKTSCDVNVVSREGLLMLTKVSNYDENGSKVTTLDNSTKTIDIENVQQAKEINQSVIFVNNYDNPITNVKIVGKIGALNSTFVTNLVKEITVNKSDAKIYYSENIEATYDDETWKEEYTASSKLYKVVLKNNELQSKDGLEIKLVLKVPEQLGYNQTTYLTTQVDYIYDNQNRSDINTIQIQSKVDELSKHSEKVVQNLGSTSGANIPVELSITPVITQNYVHSKQLVTYVVKVKNNSEEELKNIVLEDIIPDNAIYTYRTLKNGYYNYLEDTNTKTKQWNIDVLKPNETKEYKIILTMADVSTEQEVLNKVKLIYNQNTMNIESKLALKPAKVLVNLSSKHDYIPGLIYDANSEIEYYIDLKSYNNEEIKNLKVQFSIPQNLEYVEGGIGSFAEVEAEAIIGEKGELKDNIFEYTVKSLRANEIKTVIIKCKVKKLQNVYTQDISAIADICMDNEIYQSNVTTVKTSQSAFEISLNCNISENQIAKSQDEIIYTIKVKNVGDFGKSVNIKDKVPEQIEVRKVEYYKQAEDVNVINTSSQDVDINIDLQKGETVTVKIIGEVKEQKAEAEKIIDVKNVAIVKAYDEELSSNEVIFKLKVDANKENEDLNNNDKENQEDQGQDTKDPDENNDNKDENTNNNNNDNREEGQTYSLSGIAWLDSDKNGQKGSNEKLLDGVIVTLINKENGNIVADKSGNQIKATTNSNGEYKFDNLEKGTYIVLFEFDTNTYTVTTYQKSGVEQKLNSDAIITTVTIDGNKKLAAITDKIEIEEENVTDIDIGLIENAIFDLSLDKQITKVTVINSQGTQEYTYKDGHTAKVDLVAKYINSASVVVNYKFIITNNGDTVGYVDSLVDSIPSGLEFSSELNKDWYKGSDGQLYTNSLSGIAIKPGESSEIELVLTKNMTENNTGVFSNNAHLEKISNLENVKEKESALENNESSADLFISIKTGSVILYTGVTIACIAVIAVGAYIIKKKILNKVI